MNKHNGRNLMKISRIETIPFRIPLKPESHFRSTLAAMEFCDPVLVRIHTDEGIVGLAEAPAKPHIYGETQQSIVTAIEEKLSPSLIGMNPFDLERIHYRMDSLKQNLAAKASIDIALHDIIGKQIGLPIYRMLGGWNDGKVSVSWMMGTKGPEEMGSEARRLYDSGFRVFKIKVGEDPQQDVINFRAIRSAVGNDATLYIDANQAYSPPDAIKAIRAMEQFGLAWAEEPVSISAGKRRLKVAQSISVPISGDESCLTPNMVAREIEDGVIGLVVLKVARTGYYQSRKIIHLCEQAGMPCLVGSQGDTGIGTIASVHLAKAFRQIRYPIENTYFLRLEDDILKEPLTIKNGFIEISEKAGLGVEIDEEKLKRYRVHL
jgi:L-alanine-DL-glutamate epimerase-like enolase superfamily enzyme